MLYARRTSLCCVYASNHIGSLRARKRFLSIAICLCLALGRMVMWLLCTCGLYSDGGQIQTQKKRTTQSRARPNLNTSTECFLKEKKNTRSSARLRVFRSTCQQVCYCIVRLCEVNTQFKCKTTATSTYHHSRQSGRMMDEWTKRKSLRWTAGVRRKWQTGIIRRVESLPLVPLPHSRVSLLNIKSVSISFYETASLQTVRANNMHPDQRAATTTTTTTTPTANNNNNNSHNSNQFVHTSGHRRPQCIMVNFLNDQSSTSLKILYAVVIISIS